MKTTYDSVLNLLNQYSKIDLTPKVKTSLLSEKRARAAEARASELNKKLEEEKEYLKQLNVTSSFDKLEVDAIRKQKVDLLQKIKEKMLTEEMSNHFRNSKDIIEKNFECEFCYSLPAEPNKMKIICKNGHGCCKICLEGLKQRCPVCKEILISIDNLQLNNIQEVKQGLILLDKLLKVTLDPEQIVREELEKLKESLKEEVNLPIEYEKEESFFIVSTENKVFGVTLGDLMFFKFKLFFNSPTVFGRFNGSFWSYSKESDENMHFTLGSLKTNSFQCGSNIGQNVFADGKIAYFVRNLTEIIHIYIKTKENLVAEKIFLFETPVKLLCFKKEELFIYCEDKFIYCFNSLKHENQIWVKEEIFAMNASLKEDLLVLTKNSVDFYRKIDLKRRKTVKFEGKIKENSKMEVFGTSILFIMGDSLVFLDTNTEEIVKIVPKAYNFSIAHDCVLICCFGYLLSFNKEREEVDRKEIGKIKVSHIFTDN